jgi:uncharacterized protein (UPF0332 family)
VSPRSTELLDAAREALRGARAALGAAAPARAVSSAYYAMLYAARAALSEHDENARSHRGSWHLFHERYVVDGRFDRTLFVGAQHAQEVRELGDYSAKAPTPEQAASLVELAERFIDAVQRLLAA